MNNPSNKQTIDRASQQQSLPPGQQLVAPGKWPIIGERLPAQSDRPATLSISDQADSAAQITLSELKQLKQTTTLIDIHCVTRWSKLGVRFTGVLLSDLLDHLGIGCGAPFVSFVSIHLELREQKSNSMEGSHDDTSGEVQCLC